jgi:hypothetical protein
MLTKGVTIEKLKLFELEDRWTRHPGRLRLDEVQVKWEIVEVCLESSRWNLLELSLVFFKD